MEYFYSVSSFFMNHWLLLAFLAPMFWAVVNIIDVYFVEGIYQDEFDGTIITNLFQLLPLLLAITWLKFSLGGLVGLQITTEVYYYLLLAVLAGILFSISFFYYYKALFHHNDVALLQIFWGLTIVLVPLLSLIFLKEALSVVSYLGMGIVLIGTTILSLKKNNKLQSFGKYLWVMLGAVFFLSLGMICVGQVYEFMTAQNFGEHGFLLVFIAYTSGMVSVGLLMTLFKKRNPTHLIKKYWKVFILLEGVASLGNFTSQRAINIAPSVSYVATIETFVPAFVLIFSLIILFFVKYFNKGDKKLVKEIYSGQLSGVWIKILAIVIMSIGIYIIS